MIKEAYEFIQGLQAKVVGDPTVYLSANSETISVTFLWNAGLHFKRSISIYDIVQSVLTDVEYAKMLVEKANTAYEEGLAAIVAAPNIPDDGTPPVAV